MADADMIQWLLERDTSAPLIAHELAEKIRASVNQDPGYFDDWGEGFLAAADFIDPEVSDHD